MIFEDQRKAIEKLHDWKVGALFMEPGTGKTRVACHLVNSTEADYVIWVGPLGTIRPKDGIDSIIDEINKWGGFDMPVAYVGIESIQGSDRIYCDLLESIGRYKKVFIVVDESFKIKNAESKRTKRLLELGKGVEYKLILNGTPICKNLLDIWSQMEFLSPLILNMTYSQFKNTFCCYTQIKKRIGMSYRVREFITGYENVDYMYSLIRNYVYECDLNMNIEQYYNTYHYDLSDSEKEEYYEIKSLYLSYDFLECRSNNIFFEMTQKMQHSYCCAESKFWAVNSIIKSVNASETIIYCKYIKSHQECSKRYPECLVLSYQKEAMGINLQKYHYTIYFDKIWDLALRIQSGRRTFRTGQEHDCEYWDLTGNVGLESIIDRNISKKISMTEYFKMKSRSELEKEL